MPGPLIYHNAPDANLPNVSSYFNNAANMINNGIKGFTDALGEIDIARRNNLTNDLYRTIAQSYDPNNVQSINDAIKAAALSDQFRYVNNDVWRNVTDDFRTHKYEQLDKENLALAKRKMDAYQTAANISRANASISGCRNANTAAQQLKADNNIISDSVTSQAVNDIMDSAAKRGLLGAQTAATRAKAGREQAIFDSQQAEAEYKQKWLQITNANTDDITKGRLSLELMTEAANDKRLNPLGRYNLYSWLRTGEDNNAQINEALGPDSGIATSEEAQAILDDINRGGSNQDVSKLAARGINTSSGSSIRRTPTEEEVRQEQQRQEAAVANYIINRGVSQGLGAQATWNALNAPIAQEQTPNLTSGSNAFTNIQQTRQERQAQDLADASSGFLPQFPNTNISSIGGWTNPSTLISQAAQPQQIQNVTSGSPRSVQATYSGTDFSNVPKNVDLGNMTPEQQVAVKAVADAVANYDYAKHDLAPGNQVILEGSVLNETAKVNNQINSKVNQC